MQIRIEDLQKPDIVHSWLKKVSVAYIPGDEGTLLTESFISNLLDEFRTFGHEIQDHPTDDTDILITEAPFGESLSWRKSLIVTCRTRYQLSHLPTVFTIVPVKPDQLSKQLDFFEKALAKPEPDPADFDLPGLASNAYQVLYEQGRRAGPILALERVVQAQSKCIRVLLLVGEDTPQSVYHFDLVGAYPESKFKGDRDFYQDVVLRMVTSVSTHEVTQHQVAADPIPKAVWDSLDTPRAMRKAAQEMDQRQLFTHMVHISDLVNVPAVSEAIASQYSEGCFVTWDVQIEALIATVTGSARPVDKGSITDDDLSVIIGVRSDGEGALIRYVEGKRNDPPSSEAVEMAGMDALLPKIMLSADWQIQKEVPVIRSKLHIHRGISGFDPELVEFVPLESPYYYYPVTCATEAQAHGIIQAFSRSETLTNPDDPRQIAFTVLPTHGIVIAEKWVPGTEPFELICDYIDQGRLVIDNRVPQGQLEFTKKGNAMVIKTT